MAEDGRTYYAETSSAKYTASLTPWLRKHVLPKLCGPTKSRDEIADDLIVFMGKDPEIWAYYADYDWVVLCQLYGAMIHLPEGWPKYCRDLMQLWESLGSPPVFAQMEDKHNALADALWVRHTWGFLQNRMARKIDAIVGLAQRIQSEE